MTTTLTRQMNLPAGAPVALVLDRSASMATRDCPEGATRWAYAIAALKEAIGTLIDEGHQVTLLTCGRDVEVHEHIKPEQLEHLLWGDPLSCVGQAAMDALYYAPRMLDGAIVVISDGVPDQDTRVGAIATGDPNVMRHLLSRAYFLTVGEVSRQLESFARIWPNSARLEDLMKPQPSRAEVLARIRAASIAPEPTILGADMIEHPMVNLIDATPDEEPVTEPELEALEQADTLPPPASAEAQRGSRSGRKR
jgi:hypothetical protein